MRRAIDEQRQEAEQLRRQLAGAQEEAAGLRQQLDQARADARYWEDRAAWEARRYAWARERQAQQRNNLGLRPSLEECLNEYERAVPAPMRREPA